MNVQDKLLNSISQLVMIPYIVGQKQIQINMANYIAWLEMLTPDRQTLRVLNRTYDELDAPFLKVVSDQPATTEKEAPSNGNGNLTLTAMNADDDLTAINGIGPGIAQKLKNRGITTFAQVASWTDSEVETLEEEIIRFSGRIKREDWIGQAKALTQLQ